MPDLPPLSAHFPEPVVDCGADPYVVLHDEHFASHEGIVPPGHASFVLTPDQTHGWMVFHAARHAGARWDRQVRLRAFRMSTSGLLELVPPSTSAAEPSRKLRRLLGRPA